MIEKKLDVLVENNIISVQTRQFVLDIQKYLMAKRSFIDVDKLEVFLVHLAMADARRMSKDRVDALSREMMLEIENSAHFLEVSKLWKDIENKFPEYQFHRNEIELFYLHLINILME